MRRLLSLSFTALLVMAQPVFAQHDHGAHHSVQTQAAPLSDGLVKKVDKASGEVIIQHGQLDSIGMPPMTMAFGVADKRWLNTLKAGDKIRFAAEMKGGNALVSRYELAK